MITQSLTKKSQLSDLNRVPARYEGAALPGELSWQLKELGTDLPHRVLLNKVPIVYGKKLVTSRKILNCLPAVFRCYFFD